MFIRNRVQQWSSVCTKRLSQTNWSLIFVPAWVRHSLGYFYLYSPCIWCLFMSRPLWVSIILSVELLGLLQYRSIAICTGYHWWTGEPVNWWTAPGSLHCTWAIGSRNPSGISLMPSLHPGYFCSLRDWNTKLRLTLVFSIPTCRVWQARLTCYGPGSHLGTFPSSLAPCHIFLASHHTLALGRSQVWRQVWIWKKSISYCASRTSLVSGPLELSWRA